MFFEVFGCAKRKVSETRRVKQKPTKNPSSSRWTFQQVRQRTFTVRVNHHFRIGLRFDLLYHIQKEQHIFLCGRIRSTVTVIS